MNKQVLLFAVGLNKNFHCFVTSVLPVLLLFSEIVF